MKFKFLLKIKTNKGGDGVNCNFFKKNKIIKSGGDGGKSGSVYIKFDKNIKNFEFYFNKNIIETKKGFNGKCNFKNGKNSNNLILRIPYNLNYKNFYKKIKLLRGRFGGLGNSHFKKNINLFKIGEKSKEILLKFNINIKSNIFIIGFTNTGKSTFINNLSKNYLKISNYKFTTKNPNKLKIKNLVFIDFPGLVKKSFSNLKLSLNFLKNYKNFLIFNFIDVSLINYNFKIFIKNIKIFSNEIFLYKKLLWYKPKWIIFNKIDLIKIKNLRNFIKKFLIKLNWNNKKFFISSLIYKNCNFLIKNFLNINKFCEKGFEPLNFKF